jgi:hypothetical protein
MQPASFRFDAGRLDDRPPLLDFSLVIGAERLRRLLVARRNLLAQIGESPAHVRIGYGLDDAALSLAMTSLGVPLGTQNACQTAM